MAEPITTPLADALRGRYRLERELGRGGMATVWLAHDLRHNRSIALKLLRPELLASVGTARFQREIRLTAQLQHPGILPLLDSGDVAGQLWYAMPYVEGGTLRERLRREGPLPLPQAVALVRQVAAALQHAHERGVVHRDLKPENILISSSGPVIADLGIARTLDLAGEQRLTEAGLAVGTPEYMSPEQITAGARVDQRSDVYALASVLYELLAGEPPYSGISRQAVIAKRLTAPLPQLRVVRPDVPAVLEQVIAKGLAKAPADRYASAAEFAAALDGCLSGAGPTNAVPLPMVRRRMRWRAAALAATIAAIMAAAVLWRARRAEPRAALDANTVVVLPFRVTAPDSASNYLREGVVDLLNARLTGEGLPRAVDSRTTLARWRRVGRGRAVTHAQALELARDLGAARVVVGEFVRTPARSTVSGRVLRVPDGELAMEHRESVLAGELDELALLDRWVGRLFAATAGEGAGRLPTLSDSANAVKAYLDARQAHSRGELERAAALYRRALEIDSMFALAAYGLLEADERRGALYPEDYRRAWALRDRLSERDRAQLFSSPGIGPRYPDRYTSREMIRLIQRSAELNPDRAEAQAALGSYLLIQGAAASIPDWLSRSVRALDRAVQLDSTDGDPLWWRVYAALIQGDHDGARRLAALYVRRSPRADWGDAARWMVAHATGDSATLAELGARFDRLSGSSGNLLVAVGIHLGLSLDPIERALTARPFPETWHCERFHLLHTIAAVRGQVARVLALADSANRTPQCGLRRVTLEFSLADSGYGSAPDDMVRELTTHGDTTSDDAEAVCLGQLWRISRSDTMRSRRAIARIREIVRVNEHPVPLGVGSLGTCVRLLEAGIEALRPDGSSMPALARLDSLMMQGVFLETPLTLANLFLARRFAARGDLASGLAAVRRLGYHPNPYYARLRPAYLQEEGRLAALTGDTAGAIRAYQHYLRLRDRPDPGPMAEEVHRVKAHLGELVAERVER